MPVLNTQGFIKLIDSKQEGRNIFLDKFKCGYSNGDFFWNTIVPYRIKAGGEFGEKLDEYKLFNTGKTSILNDSNKHTGFRIENLAAFFSIILFDAENRGKKSYYIGYTFEDLNTVFQFLDKEGLKRTENTFNGNAPEIELRQLYNDFLEELTGYGHPFGLIQISEDWELISFKKEEEEKKRYWILMAIALFTLFTFRADHVLRSYPDDVEISDDNTVEVKAPLADLNARLGELYHQRKWIVLDEEAKELLDNLKTRDIGLYYLGMSQIEREIQSKSPAYYLLKIDPESRFYNIGLLSLHRFYCRKHEKELLSQIQEIFDNLELDGNRSTPIWYHLKVKTSIWENRIDEDNFNYSNAYLEILNIYHQIEKSFADVIDYESMIFRIDKALTLEEYKNNPLPLERLAEACALTDLTLEVLEKLSINEYRDKKIYWERKRQQLKDGIHPFFIQEGTWLLGYNVERKEPIPSVTIKINDNN